MRISYALPLAIALMSLGYQNCSQVRFQTVSTDSPAGALTVQPDNTQLPADPVAPSGGGTVTSAPTEPPAVVPPTVTPPTVTPPTVTPPTVTPPAQPPMAHQPEQQLPAQPPKDPVIPKTPAPPQTPNVAVKDHEVCHGEKEDDDDKDRNHESEHEDSDDKLYVCVLDDAGKSVKLAFIAEDEMLLGKTGTPMDICMSRKACLEIVAKSFAVKSAEPRGFCKQKSAHTVEFNDKQMQSLVDKG